MGDGHGRYDKHGRKQRVVFLTDDEWRWLDATSAKQGIKRPELVERLVVAAMERAAANERCHRPVKPLPPEPVIAWLCARCGQWVDEAGPRTDCPGSPGIGGPSQGPEQGGDVP